MQFVRSRQGRSIASAIFIIAWIVFWMAFLLFPFENVSGFPGLSVSGFEQISGIIYIVQSTLYASVSGLQLQITDLFFFAYPLGMLIAFPLWVFKVRRGSLLALISYLGLISTGFTTNIGFLVSIVAIAICALTTIAD